MPLLKSHISTLELYSPEWKQARLAKLTSSNNWKLMGAKGLGETGMGYIREKVYEELSGESSERDVDTDDTRWGHLYEPEALNNFGLKMGIEFLIVGKLIADPDSRFGGTPDALWLQSETADKQAYNVFPVEAKCYQGKNHIKLCECNTPADVKEKDTSLYWQILDQMFICDSLRGYTVNYHPLLKVGGLKIIEYRKTELIEEFKFMKLRKQQAEKEFNRIREILLKN